MPACFISPLDQVKTSPPARRVVGFHQNEKARWIQAHCGFLTVFIHRILQKLNHNPLFK
jgi:hypothetical protein